MLLSYYQRYSDSGIALQLGVPLDTIKSHMRSAVRSLGTGVEKRTTYKHKI